MAGHAEDDPRLSTWKLVRSAIEHENTLKSHRITWLLATQVFLFSGFTQIFNEAVVSSSAFKDWRVFCILFLTCLLGAYTSLLAWVNVKAAQKAISRLQNWWLVHHCPPPDKEGDEDWVKRIQYGCKEIPFPPIHGIFTKNLYQVFDEKQLPAVIAWAWLALLILTTYMFLSSSFPAGLCNLLAITLPAAACLLVVIVAAYFRAREWLKSESRESMRKLTRFCTKKQPSTTPGGTGATPSSAP
ncbi:MAG: hypothetical protein ACO3B3_08525 [Cyanobium sp.]